MDRADASRIRRYAQPCGYAHAQSEGNTAYVNMSIYSFVSILTQYEIFQVSDSQERASSKRFLLRCHQQYESARDYSQKQIRTVDVAKLIIIFI